MITPHPQCEPPGQEHLGARIGEYQRSMTGRGDRCIDFYDRQRHSGFDEQTSQKRVDPLEATVVMCIQNAM